MFENVSEENFSGEKSKRGGGGWDRLLDSRAAWRRYGGGIEKWQLLANDIIWSWIDIFWLMLCVYILPEQKYETSGTSDHLVWHSLSRVVFWFIWIRCQDPSKIYPEQTFVLRTTVTSINTPEMALPYHQIGSPNEPPSRKHISRVKFGKINIRQNKHFREKLR